ncbi:ABC transporter ATP-binding protein [Pseudonocardia sp. WMMC193]|uniref:ABC transporter ATP-binding protein n=1 Tax=Pseudonocardia sp. WMMC193 TaxID=2911965 RepID=UPI001F312AA3|nr:ABC transporter ATP-binding protein [Pseudonocardia sp. WMMC193]MCF7549996.1 ABC transporter ATP-binding protein [Pseudonocardia sp. WMMC193]
MSTPTPPDEGPGHGELRARDVVRTFGGAHGVRAVDEVTARFSFGVRTGIVGESGSGKSTLGRMLVGLDRPTSGAVEYRGLDLSTVLGTRPGRSGFRREVQYIGQDTTGSFDPRHTLRHAVTTSARRLLTVSREEAEELTEQVLARLGLAPAMADRRPDQVSGGQRQRFAIARALVARPRMLVCDEVVSALDVSVQGAILNLLKSESAAAGTGLVFISHGLPATAFLCDEIVVMHRGRIVEHGPATRLVHAPEHPYTRTLLAAHPQRAVAS